MQNVVKLLRQKFNIRTNEKSDPNLKTKVKAQKARVKVYPSIQQALEKGTYGHMFSTDRADRVYVISKGRGKQQAKDVPTSGGRIAKGFTPGSATPSADWKSVKKHATRTAMKHGAKTSKRHEKEYGAGSKKQEKTGD
jgi:hypothetical protein